MIIGKFAQSDALAAVGSTSALTNLIVNIFVGFAVGGNVVCAKCYGARNIPAFSRAVHTSFFLAIILGIPLALVGWFASNMFLGVMGTPDDVIGKASLYMKIYFLGAPASLIYNYGAAILRSVGDTKRPLYILGISGIVNVIINFVCVVFFLLNLP